MNEADEALSNSALASTDEPSGVRTDTRQVMSNALDFSFTAVLEDTLVASLSSPLVFSTDLGASSWFDMKSVMWFPANLAFVNRSTLFLEVGTGEAVGAQVVRLEYSILFVMRESLELGTGIQRMPLSFRDNAVSRGPSIGGESCNFCSRASFLWDMKLLRLVLVGR